MTSPSTYLNKWKTATAQLVFGVPCVVWFELRSKQKQRLLSCQPMVFVIKTNKLTHKAIEIKQISKETKIVPTQPSAPEDLYLSYLSAQLDQQLFEDRVHGAASGDGDGGVGEASSAHIELQHNGQTTQYTPINITHQNKNTTQIQ